MHFLNGVCLSHAVKPCRNYAVNLGDGRTVSMALRGPRINAASNGSSGWARVDPHRLPYFRRDVGNLRC
jgi:hypothetical protein